LIFTLLLKSLLFISVHKTQTQQSQISCKKDRWGLKHHVE